MSADDSAVGKPVEFLQDAEYLQIAFATIPNGSTVLGGKAVVVLNGSQRFEFAIPPQKMQDFRIFVRRIQGFLGGHGAEGVAGEHPEEE